MSEEHKPIEFVFRGKAWDLWNILDNDHVFESGDDGSGRGYKIVTRAGVGKLIDYFGAIDITFGPIQTANVCGEEVIAIECCAEDMVRNLSQEDLDSGWKLSTRPGRSFGEASSGNCIGIAAKYPVSMATKRGIARAVFDLLGIRDAYSEDEAEEFREEVKERRRSGKTESPPKKETPQETVKEIVAEIAKLIDALNLSEEDKLEEYRSVIGDSSLTKSQIIQRATKDVKIQVRDRLRERAKNKG